MPLKDPVERREYHRKYMRRRYNEDPVHRNKQLVRVRTRNLTRPETCICGADTPEAHHPDYGQPALVVWLCRECHRNEHPGEC